MSKIHIRPATIGDAVNIAAVRSDAILSVDKTYYESAVLSEWAGAAEDRVKTLLSNSADIRIVAEAEGKILGYGELVTSQNLLGACYVSPQAKGEGVGKAIVKELERIAREKGCPYLRTESSANAEEFYIRCGYEVLVRAKHGLRSGAVMDCVVMKKKFE